MKTVAITISIGSFGYKPMRSQHIHRVNKKRINHEDVASLVEGADDGPDESVCEIHCVVSVDANFLISDGLVQGLSLSSERKFLVAGILGLELSGGRATSFDSDSSEAVKNGGFAVIRERN